MQYIQRDIGTSASTPDGFIAGVKKQRNAGVKEPTTAGMEKQENAGSSW